MEDPAEVASPWAHMIMLYQADSDEPIGAKGWKFIERLLTDNSLVEYKAGTGSGIDQPKIQQLTKLEALLAENIESMQGVAPLEPSDGIFGENI